jgi:hypothetical protein
VRRLTRLAIACLFSSLVTLVAAISASAGVYVVHACQHPDGKPAALDGWHVATPEAGVRYDISCTDGTGFGVSTLGDRAYPRGFHAGVDLAAPPDLLIVGARAKQDLYSTGSSTGAWAWMVGSWGKYPAEPNWRALDFGCYGAVGVCDDYQEPYRILLYPRDAPRYAIRLGIGCDFNRGECPAGSGAASYTSMLELVLEDRLPPQFQVAPTGSLIDLASQEAVRSISFSASDRGSGLLKAVLEIDGQSPQVISLGEAGSSCVPPYDKLAPCPKTASGTFHVDTSAWPMGNYAGRLLVYDATDTSPLVYNFTVHKAGKIRSCHPGNSFLVNGRQRAFRYRESRRLSFRVRSSVPLPRRLLVLRGDAKVRLVGQARLHKGRYVVRQQPGPSRLLRLAPPARLGEVRYSCSNAIPVRVRAGLRFTARPKRLRNGATVTFRGRLLGGRVAQGRSVLIQARARGGTPRWTPVRVVRTRKRGAFRMTYTFRRTQQPVRYEFRTLMRREKGFPYARGVSPIRIVLVLP